MNGDLKDCETIFMTLKPPHDLLWCWRWVVQSQLLLIMCHQHGHCWWRVEGPTINNVSLLQHVPPQINLKLQKQQHIISGVWGQEAADRALWSGWYFICCFFAESGLLSACKWGRGGEVPLCHFEGKNKMQRENSPCDIWHVSSVVWIKNVRERQKKGLNLDSGVWWKDQSCSGLFSLSSQRSLYHHMPLNSIFCGFAFAKLVDCNWHFFLVPPQLKF